MKKLRYKPTRRTVIKSVAAAGAAISLLQSNHSVFAQAVPGSKKLPLKIAGYKFNRVAALVDGRVGVDGCDVRFDTAAIGDMNSEAFSGLQTWDVTEIGLHPFMLAYANEGFRDYTLLPIFPLRMFRHRSVFIRNDRGITKPDDLRGRTIATPGYSSTSLTWIRGIFQDEYGLSPKDVQWIVARKDSSAKDAGKVSEQENVVPDGVPIKMGPEGMDESDLIESGLVDALFHAAEPRAYIQRHPKVVRLFPDYRSVEQAYFAKTGIFPIMHAVAIKQRTAQDNPWLVRAVFDAYSQARLLNYEYMAKSAWIYETLPWYAQEFEETRALMGENYDSYGIAANRKTLQALLRYSSQQGLAKRQPTIDELFHPASLSFVEKNP